MFTRQQTYEASCLAIVEQGRPARAEDGAPGCRYLLEDGRRCAAGHLMHKASPAHLLKLNGRVGQGDVDELLTDHDLELVRALQRAHDVQSYRVSHSMYEHRWTLEQHRWTLEQWRADWLVRVSQVARDFALDSTRVLDAARAKGWKIPEVLS